MQGFERLFEYLWICLMTLIRDICGASKSVVKLKTNAAEELSVGDHCNDKVRRHFMLLWYLGRGKEDSLLVSGNGATNRSA